MKTIRHIVTLILFCFGSIAALCQEKFNLEFGLNYGSYKMEQVKAFQENVKDNYPVEPKTMSNFPATVGYEGRIGYTLYRFTLFLFGSFNSSGSRLSYQDYSGSYEYNQLGKFKQFGTGAEFRLNKNPDSPWAPFIATQIAFGKTDFNINDRTEVGGQTLSEEDLDFVSSHLTLYPAIGLRRKFLDRFSISSSLGYCIDLPASPLEYAEDRDYYLVDDNSAPVSADWSGFRATLSLSVRF